MDYYVYYLVWTGNNVAMRVYLSFRNKNAADSEKAARAAALDVRNTKNNFIVGVIVIAFSPGVPNTNICAYYRPFCLKERVPFAPVPETDLAVEPMAYWEMHFIDTGKLNAEMPPTVFEERLKALEECIRAIDAECSRMTAPAARPS